METNALNYNDLATEDDGSCEYPVFGCIDSLAINFDPLATEDDSTCLYFEDLIIGTWTGVSSVYTFQISPELEMMLQNMSPDDFLFEFDIEMPTTEEEWGYFYQTNFGESEDISGSTLQFDGENFILNEEGDIESFPYSFTSTTSFDIDATEIGITYFDVIICTDTDLKLYTELYFEEEGEEAVAYDLYVTFER